MELEGNKLSAMGLTTSFIYLFKFPGRKDQKSLSNSETTHNSPFMTFHNCNYLFNIFFLP